MQNLFAGHNGRAVRESESGVNESDLSGRTIAKGRNGGHILNYNLESGPMQAVGENYLSEMSDFIIGLWVMSDNLLLHICE
jgi:hypothetical protein